MKTTDEIIAELSSRFACLTRYTYRRHRDKCYFQAESVYLKGGHHFICDGDTPLEAVRELYKQIKNLTPL